MTLDSCGRHSSAIGVERHAGSRFVEQRGTALSITRVLLEDGTEQDVRALPSEPGPQRPRVYCPFCGRPGKYAHPRTAPDSIIPHYVHANGHPQCDDRDLEELRHARAIQVLKVGLEGLRERGLPMEVELPCRRCGKEMRHEIAAKGTWDRAEPEVRRLIPERRPDLVAFHREAAVVVFEVCYSNPLDSERRSELEAHGLPGLELGWEALLDQDGRARWIGDGPLPSSKSSWNLETNPRGVLVCTGCRNVPREYQLLARLISRVQARDEPGATQLAALVLKQLDLPGSIATKVPNAIEAIFERPEAVREAMDDATLQKVGRLRYGPNPLPAVLKWAGGKSEDQGKQKVAEFLRDPFGWLIAECLANRIPAREDVAAAERIASFATKDLSHRRLTARACRELAVACENGHTARDAAAIRRSLERECPDLGNLDRLLDDVLETGRSGIESWRTSRGELRLSLKPLAEQEERIAAMVLERLRRGASKGAPLPPDADEQIRAVAMALREPMSLITGGPGTGKTTVIGIILRQAARAPVERKRSWVLAAPTNKAVGRIRQSLGAASKADVRTLHGWCGSSGRDDLRNVRPFGMIVDEASFIDTETMGNLLEVCREASIERLVLVGDPNQLASIDHGAVLRDLLESGVVKSSVLTKSFRATDGRGIREAALEIASGIVPRKAAGVQLETSPDDITVSAMDFFRALGGARQPETVQIIAAKRDLVKELNRRAQELVNPGGMLVHTEAGVRIGDRVLVAERPQSGTLRKGSLGWLRSLNGDRLHIEVDGEGLKDVPVEDLGALAPGYAMTIHKAQGSEWHKVIVVLEGKFPDRTMVYTAATRARNDLVIVGRRDEVVKAIGRRYPRQTLLAERIQKLAGVRALESVRGG